jgi:outer membrane lipoprotein carrier protein
VKFGWSLKTLATIAYSFVAVANLSAQDPRIIVERFERTYRSSKTLRANFLQRYLENGKEVRSEAGVSYFGRPGKMRWEYQSPERNLYVVDGKWSWFYVPADHTVTRIRAKESADWRTPFALLAGEMKVSRICGRVSVASRKAPPAPGNVVLQCETRAGSGSQRDERGSPAAGSEHEAVFFEVNAASGELARVLVSDPGGVEVEFRFSSWQFDPGLEAKLFRFDPPKGVAIVDGDLPAGIQLK